MHKVNGYLWCGCLLEGSVAEAKSLLFCSLRRCRFLRNTMCISAHCDHSSLKQQKKLEILGMSAGRRGCWKWCKMKEKRDSSWMSTFPLSSGWWAQKRVGWTSEEHRGNLLSPLFLSILPPKGSVPCKYLSLLCIQKMIRGKGSMRCSGEMVLQLNHIQVGSYRYRSFALIILLRSEYQPCCANICLLQHWFTEKSYNHKDFSTSKSRKASKVRDNLP